MRHKITLLLLVLPALALAQSGKTGIYKSIDAEGNTVYSDTPSIGAQKITPPPISTVESGPKPVAALPDADSQAAKPPASYTRFGIKQPKNDDVIWDNQGSIPLSLMLEPALDTANGHGVWVYIDGKTIVKQSPSLVQPISGMSRGTHKIRAEIRDSAGKVLKRTGTISVHLKKHTAPIATPH